MTAQTDERLRASPASPLTERLLDYARQADLFADATRECLTATREALVNTSPDDLDAARRGEVGGDQRLAALAWLMADLPVQERQLAQDEARAACYRRLAKEHADDTEGRSARWHRQEERRRHEERARAAGVRSPTPEAAAELDLAARRRAWVHLGTLQLLGEVSRVVLDPRRRGRS